MNTFIRKLGKTLIAAWIASTFTIGVMAWQSGGKLYAQGDNRAVIKPPEGLLKNNQKVIDAVNLLNWILLIAGAIPATVFTVYAGKKFNDQEYGAALGSALGAIISGLGGYIAFSFI